MSPFWRMFKINLIFIGISLGISIFFQILFPGLIGLIFTVGIFVCVPIFIKFLKPRGLYGDAIDYSYVCLSCGTVHRKVICPRCGSKIKKARYEPE